MFIHDLIGKWCYLSRTTPDLVDLLSPLENVISTRFLPSLTGQRAPGPLKRELFVLPARLEGLGIINLAQASVQHYRNSVAMTAPLVDLLTRQKSNGVINVYCEQLDIKKKCQKSSQSNLQLKANQLRKSLSGDLALAVHLAC